jgi:hypothetical protein
LAGQEQDKDQGAVGGTRGLTSFVLLLSLRRSSERHADPVFLDPGNSAFVNRGVASHHQAKVRWNESGVLDVDGGALGRDVPHCATHDGAARGHVGRLIDFGPWVLSLFFHRVQLSLAAQN